MADTRTPDAPTEAEAWRYRLWELLKRSARLHIDERRELNVAIAERDGARDACAAMRELLTAKRREIAELKAAANAAGKALHIVSQQRESRIAWALEADRLEQVAAQLCEDLHRAQHDRDYYRKVAAEWYDARPSVSDQTPADRHVSPSPVRAQGDPQ